VSWPLENARDNNPLSRRASSTLARATTILSLISWRGLCLSSLLPSWCVGYLFLSGRISVFVKFGLVVSARVWWLLFAFAFSCLSVLVCVRLSAGLLSSAALLLVRILCFAAALGSFSAGVFRLVVAPVTFVRRRGRASCTSAGAFVL
jgi:hypothetical protein